MLSGVRKFEKSKMKLKFYNESISKAFTLLLKVQCPFQRAFLNQITPTAIQLNLNFWWNQLILYLIKSKKDYR